MPSFNTLTSSLVSNDPSLVNAQPTSISVSADGRIFALGSFSGMRVYARENDNATQSVLIATVLNDYASADGDVLVAISPDGSTIAAKFEEASQDAIKIYALNMTSATVGSLTLQATFTSSARGFGESFSFSDNGNLLVAGFPGATITNNQSQTVDNSGSVLVYSRSGSTWSLSNTISNPNQGLEDYFGYDVSLSNDGSTLAIGSVGEENPSTTRTGAVYIYDLGTNSLVKKIIADDCDAGTYFGSSVSMSGNGQRLAIGAAGKDDTAYSTAVSQDYSVNLNKPLVVYKLSTGAWSLEHNAFMTVLSSYFYNIIDIKMSANSNSMAVLYMRNYVEYGRTERDNFHMDVFNYDGVQWTGTNNQFSLDRANYSLGYSFKPTNVFLANFTAETAGAISLVEVSGLTDLVSPTISDVSIVVKDQTYSSVTLRWAAAVDDVSSASSMRYDVRYSSSNNMSTLALAEANGTLYQTVTGVNSSPLEIEVTDLALNSTYYFTIIAKDLSGNKAKYDTISGATLADLTPPIPATDGAPISYTSTKTSVTLTWPLANDNVTEQPLIQYAVYRVPIFTAGYTGSIETTESMGTLLMPYAANTTYTDSSLLPGSLYGYNVIAKDASGNKVAYSPVGATTQADDIAPTVSSKTLSVSDQSYTGYKITWNSASDDFSSRTSIYYLVYESSSNNIATVANAEANGTVIAQFFGADTATQFFSVTGKSVNSSKYYNVIARDAAGNKLIYTSASASTLADTTGPTYGSQPTTTADYNSITISYSSAQDDITSSQNIQYALYRLPTSSTSVAYIEQSGILVRDYLASTADIVVPNLNSGTTYYFALVGKDEAGNKTLYSSFSKTTQQDAVPPVPGANGFITKSNVTAFGFTMSWSRATDDITNSLDLEYAIYSSSNESDLASLEAISAPGSNAGMHVSFTKDLMTANIALSGSVTYYYTVIVRDSRGNRAKYQTVNNRNPSDTTAPIPGNSGILTLTPNGYSAVTIQYGLALDNFSHFTQNQYKIVISPLNNISTVADAEANGIVVRDWATFTNAGFYDVIVPVPGQFYFFNVIVRDTEGNKAVYVSKAGRSQVDATAPTVNNSIISLVTNALATPSSVSPTLKISWNQATDNQTAQSNIKYSIYLAPDNPSMSTVQQIESLSDVRRWTVMGSEGSEFQFPSETVAISTQYSINIVAEDSLGNKTPYSKITFTTPGDVYPPFVNNSTLTIVNRTPSSIKVMWNPASDVLSPSTVQYDLYYSTLNNVANVSSAIANGTLVVSGTYSALGVGATSGYTITGLNDGTQYYINVIARDGSGNRMAYTSAATSTLNENIPPVVAPLSLSTGSVTDTAISLTWGLATDNKTPSNLLEYSVYRSTSQMLQSVASIEAGTKVLDWTANTGSYTATGLNRNTRYFFGVVVRDQVGNKSVYSPVNALTLNDTSPPVVPTTNSWGVLGNIAYSVSFNSVSLSAPVATDNVTAGQSLVYRVYRSSSNNITTVANMIANGTYIGNGTIVLSRDLSTGAYVYDENVYVRYNDWKLLANTGYYYNIMVVDGAGNRAAYTPIYAVTSSQFVAPVVGNSGKINVITSGSGTLNLSWSLASDEIQSGSQLEYAVYYAPRITSTQWNLKNEFPPMSDAYDIQSRSAIGQITQASQYTQGMSSFTISNLPPAAEYSVNVVVRDGSGALSAYNAARVWTLTDTSAPSPGASGILTASYINDSGFVVSWNKASDDYSAQNRLRYEVRVSTQNNIGTVDTFKNGNIVAPFATDINSATVAGLQPATQYYVNVMVMDVAGNKAVYQTQTVITGADTAGPTPLLNMLVFSQIGKQSMRVSWSKATDNSTFREDIEYALYMSTQGATRVSTVNQMESTATLVQDYLADTDYAIVTDLVPGIRYYFNVVAKDKFGNKTAYAGSFADTLEDNTPPTPGANGELLTTHVGQTSVSLAWTHAVEDLSGQSVTYTVYKSLSNNINTVNGAETNGIAVVDGLVANSYTITGLNPSSTYYFTVVAQDPRGNAAAYSMISVDTIVDTTVPSPGNSGIINTSMVTGDGLTLSWTKGTDNITVEGDLQYAIYMSTNDNMTDLSSTLSNGTRIRDFARNISVSTISRLQPLTQYYFNVVVRDSFGNMSAYNSVSATTLADTTGPTPGGGGAITFSSVDKDSMIVSWNQAEDNSTAGSQIQYQLRMAMSNLGVVPDFSTVAATEANGTIVKAYSTSPFALISNLASNTTYYFNVIAKDAAGNKSVYVSGSQKTANSLVEIPTQSVEVNQPVVIASNKDEIKALPGISSHPTLSRPSNWKKVHMIYKSTVSSKRVVVVITDFSQMSGEFITRDTEEFVVHKIIVEDENNNFVAVPASSILNSQSWSISVT